MSPRNRIARMIRIMAGALFMILEAAMLAGCDSGGSDGGDAPQAVALSISQTDITNKGAVALTPDSGALNPSARARGSRALLSSPGEDSIAVSMDASGTVEPVYSTPLAIKSFSIPTEIRQGEQYMAASGIFTDVPTPEGDTIDCNVVAGSLSGTDELVCLYSAGPEDDPTIIPVAVIRDGSSDGYLETSESVYFAINKLAGGASVFKYNDGLIRQVGHVQNGRITKFLRGAMAIFGYDESGASGSYVFGSERRSLQRGTIGDTPLFYKHYILYPMRPVDRDDEVSNQSMVFDLNESSSTNFADEFSIDCKNPASIEQSAVHDFGVFWISSDDSKLCEAYEPVNRPENLLYRIVDEQGLWSQIRISNNVLVGIVTLGGETRLIIDDTIPSGDRGLGDDRVIDTSNKLPLADLDSVVSIADYPQGVLIEGEKDSQTAVRYFNTQTKTFDSSPDPDAALRIYSIERVPTL